ncbi:MAG TPA: hypothetical protein PLK37_03865 [Terricaulis sp.]|nr:hypothetical protein [Terricaulis sp.]
MRHPLRALALALALAATPACASLQLGETRIENPLDAARSIDQRAYALLHSYAAIVEEAGDIVRDPAAPLSLKRALGRAERAATPAVEALQISVAAFLRARADYEAATGADQPALTRAANALTIAANRLSEAVAAAERPVGELEALIRRR